MALERAIKLSHTSLWLTFTCRRRDPWLDPAASINSGLDRLTVCNALLPVVYPILIIRIALSR